ncbi:MAG: hypothetical protein E7551_05925, partial [Ruminococcaceae bacterium]|nr:hypothetical protein [Oscillospiraceae bacterium]
MKKVLAVVLCLIIIVSSLTTVLFSGVSANTENNIFDDPANWELYEFNTQYVNSENGKAPTRGSITTNTNTAYTYGGDSSSIKIGAKIQMSTVEFEVEKNKDYTLSYRFLTSGAKYASNGFDTYLVRTGIIVPEGTVTWGTDGYVVYMATNAAYTAPNGVFANRTSIANRTTDWLAEGAWNQVTMKFNSGDNTTLKLLVQAGTDTFYVDDFSLNEVFDFESLSNWGIYAASSSDANYTVVTNYDGESCQTKNGWMSITNNTAQDADSTGKSVRINGNTVNIAANLPVLKANTKYTLSFKYKPGATSAIASNGAYFTSHIIKKGTAFNSGKSGPAEFVADLGKGTETSDWKELSVDFTTDTTTDYMLEFRFAYAAGYECFIDAITLTEKEKATYFIQDFEDYTKSKSEYVGSISIVTPEGTSVSGTKALQYDGTAEGAQTGEGSNRVILNPASSDLPVLTEFVNKGDKFKVTFKYKLLSGEVK